MNMMKRLSALLLAVLLLAGLGVTAFAADSAVTYAGGAEKFVFTGGGLFPNFTDLIPGDTVTQNIDVRVDSKFGGPAAVRLFLRAEAHGAGNPLTDGSATLAESEDLLSKLTMTVKQGEKVLYDGKLNGGAMGANIELGSFKKGEGTALTLELKVPAALDNAYINRRAELDWVFTAEELDVPSTPATGDDTNPMPYIVGLCVSLLAIVVIVIVLLKKRKQDEE